MLACVLLLVGAASSIFLAGGAPQGNLGVFLLCAGATLIVCPPWFQPPRFVTWLAVAFLGCSAAALLPWKLFPEMTWRRTLSQVPGLSLPDTVSADPAQTVFWLGVLAITVSVGLFLLTQSTRSHGLRTLAMGGAVLCGTYAALSIYAKLSGWVYPFSGGAAFGFLPNRNHTATLLVTGSILSLGLLVVAGRERRWLAFNVALTALMPCVFALLFFSASRGGVVFLLVGLVGWIAGLGKRHRSRTLWVTAAVATLLGAGIFLTAKSEVRNRLLEPALVHQTTDANDPTKSRSDADDRLKIYHDTLGMIRDAPWTGTGLGTFPLVFPAYRETLFNTLLVLHPESDWLMVAAETGLPACACLGGLICVVLWLWRPDREHPYWPLRWGVFMAAATAVLHGFVDVPVHRAALGWWILALTGLALQPGGSSRGPTPGKHPVARAVFIGVGLSAVLLGAMLVRAEWFGGPALPPFGADRANEDILQTFNRGDFAGALRKARQSVRQYPLTSNLYSQLGVLLLRLDDTDTDAEAAQAFFVQRRLSPLTPVVPQRQAVSWLGIDPPRSAALFTEALERQERLDAQMPTNGGGMVYFRELVQRAAAAPVVQNLLWDTAVARGVDGELAWLEGAAPEVAKKRLESLVVDEPFLTKLNPGQRQKFLTILAQRDQAISQAFLRGRGSDWAPPPAPSPAAGGR